MQLNGFHHLTAITADAPRNHAFYTQVLGLRLVKKSVNQDDVSAYHLFYADGKGSPGTDITFFDWPAAPERRGTHSICRTGFRVQGEKAFSFWADRLKTHGVAMSAPVEKLGRVTLDFEDFEGQRLSLVNDESATPFAVWEKSSVPPDHQIRGLGPITLSVPDIAPTEMVLTKVMGMTKATSHGSTHIYWMKGKGPVAELHVLEEPDLKPAQQGAGGVHHVAFNVAMADYVAWAERLKALRVPNSGPVDRYWFKSLYFREPNGILFEIATDGPGFQADEPMEKLGETLSLPPFLEARRATIEAGLKKL
ncbi:MAG: ring-cleaving dioxygenase [Phyllobacteriaceae bacterium]|nr:ring-cleaving dioxygenase [Phyllobacteriaceae bacterium]